jgi:chemotaxis family two-component system response regulator Rcp1
MRPLNILLVDDNPAEALLVREALKDCSRPTTLHTTADGVEALTFLHHAGPFVNAPRPALILLDLNMPRKDGYSVLADIRSDPDLQQLLVIIFSSSEEQTDIDHSYALGANGYIKKPQGLHDYFQAIRTIVEFGVRQTTPAAQRGHRRTRRRSKGGEPGM